MRNIQILDPHQCTGCGACSNSCLHSAISMCEDSEGFLHPVIDDTKCTDCGLCMKTCPVLSDKGENKDDILEQHSYLVTKTCESLYKKSATAGLCTLLSQFVINNGGCVYGVILDESTWKANHMCVENIADLEKMRNSKYMQSDTNSTFIDVKTKLKIGRQVLYVGTPCQIAGLKAFLGKDYPNLLTIDLVCHGVYSYRLIREEVDYWSKFFRGKISNFRFRSKERYSHPQGGIINFDLKRWPFSKHIEILGSYSPTYRCYAYSEDGKNYNLRYSCYGCPFRSANRYGDFTIGDPWNITQKDTLIHTSENIYNGISLVCCNTIKANNVFQRINKHFIYSELPHDEAFKQDALKEDNRSIPLERNILYQNLGKKPYVEIVNQILGIDMKRMYKSYLQMEQIERIKSLLRRFLLINKCRNLKIKCCQYKSEFEHWFINNVIAFLPSKRLRYFYLKRRGMKLSPNVRFYAGFHIRNPWGITIEDGVNIGPKVLLDGRMGLHIGRNAVIAYDAVIWSLNHDYNDIHFCGKGAPVKIGAYAWICSRSIILPGVSIGEGAVVASGAIVTKDVAPYTVVGGVPAKVIGHREKKDYDYGYDAVNDTSHCW